jgi:alpha-tubulin suppressor-like RCC1 family protein
MAPITSSGAAGVRKHSEETTARPSPRVASSAGAARLTGVRSTVASDSGNCALLTSGDVDCWGRGNHGQLGNGMSYPEAPHGSATPVQVVGVGGTGTLSGVGSLVSDSTSNSSSYCALLTTGGVDCWGNGSFGELGDGTFYTSGYDGNDTPVQVVGVGGTGTLSGVASIATAGAGSYCALLTSGRVDCWGEGTAGQLGDGTFYSSPNFGSAVPVQVVGVGGTGTLSGVVSLASQGLGGNYCALLTTGGVDCWGDGTLGELGDGNFDLEATPVQVLGVGATGTLTGVASLTSNTNGFCVLLTSRAVDCWGQGIFGQLGNKIFYKASDNYGSAVPVQVVGVGGTGTLGGVESLATDTEYGYCALLTSGGVDCWGEGDHGELGNGTLYTSSQHYGSAVPVRVIGVGKSGSLSGVLVLANDIGGGSFCALLTSGGVDCWGQGDLGQIGNGKFYPHGGRATPVQVVGVGGGGTLSSVASLAAQSRVGYCVVLTTGGVDCWGQGKNGELGNGTFIHSSPAGSAVPVRVLAVA